MYTFFFAFLQFAVSNHAINLRFRTLKEFFREIREKEEGPFDDDYDEVMTGKKKRRRKKRK